MMEDWPERQIEALTFLAAIVPDENTTLHIRAFKPRKAPGHAGNVPEEMNVSRRELEDNLALWGKLREWNRQRGVYVAINSGGRTDEEITHYNAVFFEDDKRTIEDQHARYDGLPVKTSCRVQTRKSVHGYLLLKGDCTELEWRELQLRAIYTLDSDRSVKNPSRVMRIPGFDHVDYDEKRGTLSYTPIRLVECEPQRRYTVDELLNVFQPVPFEAFNPDEVEEIESIPDGERNEKLMSIAGGLRRQGLNATMIFEALKPINTALCDPPLDERELWAIAKSASRYKPEAESDYNKWDKPPEETATNPKIDKRTFFKLAAEQLEEKEAESAERRRRISTADFAALSVLCAEHGYSDKARVGLQAIIALSEGRSQFEWKYEALYPYLRRYDPELFQREEGRLSKQASSKINSIVRGYLDAIDRDWQRSEVQLAATTRGDIYYDGSGNEVYSKSETNLLVLGLLDEIDEIAKANPSYSRDSKKYRAEAARTVASGLARLKAPKKQPATVKEQIEMGIKRAGGNLLKVVQLMRKQQYEDFAIRERILKLLPLEVVEILEGDSPLDGQIVDSANDKAGQNVDHLHFSAESLFSEGIPKENKDKRDSPPGLSPGGVRAGPAIWRNADHNQPVIVKSDAGIGPDKRRYVWIEGSGAAIPLDEMVYNTGPPLKDLLDAMDEFLASEIGRGNAAQSEFV